MSNNNQRIIDDMSDAIKDKNYPEFIRLYRIADSCVLKSNSFEGDVLLEYALRHQTNIAILQFLFDKKDGHPINNTFDHSKYSPLAFAVKNSDFHVVDMLVKNYGAIIDTKLYGYDNYTVFEMAVIRHSSNILSYLIEKYTEQTNYVSSSYSKKSRKDVQIESLFVKCSPIGFAICRRSDLDTLKVLVKYNAIVDAKLYGKHKYTVFEVAAVTNSPDILLYLFDIFREQLNYDNGDTNNRKEIQQKITELLVRIIRALIRKQIINATELFIVILKQCSDTDDLKLLLAQDYALPWFEHYLCNNIECLLNISFKFFNYILLQLNFTNDHIWKDKLEYLIRKLIPRNKYAINYLRGASHAFEALKERLPFVVKYYFLYDEHKFADSIFPALQNEVSDVVPGPSNNIPQRIEEYGIDEDTYENYESELNALKLINVRSDNSKTMYDIIISRDVREISKLFKETVVFNRFKEFPNFGEILKEKMKFAVERQTLMNISTKYLCLKTKLNEAVCEMILDKLNSSDLEEFIHAFSPNDWKDEIYSEYLRLQE